MAQSIAQEDYVVDMVNAQAMINSDASDGAPPLVTSAFNSQSQATDIESQDQAEAKLEEYAEAQAGILIHLRALSEAMRNIDDRLLQQYPFNLIPLYEKAVSTTYLKREWTKITDPTPEQPATSDADQFDPAWVTNRIKKIDTPYKETCESFSHKLSTKVLLACQYTAETKLLSVEDMEPEWQNTLYASWDDYNKTWNKKPTYAERDEISDKLIREINKALKTYKQSQPRHTDKKELMREVEQIYEKELKTFLGSYLINRKVKTFVRPVRRAITSMLETFKPPPADADADAAAYKKKQKAKQVLGLLFNKEMYTHTLAALQFGELTLTTLQHLDDGRPLNLQTTCKKQT